MAQELYNENQNKNDKIVKNINDSLIKLKKDINRKNVPENENSSKIVDIIEKIENLNKQQKGKGLRIALVAKVSDRSNLKILTPKQMLQRLAIALQQVKAENTSEKLLNKIRQIINSLYRKKLITKKVYNNIMNPIKL